MRTSIKEQNGFLWSSFFTFSGMMSLIYWGFLLNLTLYFDLTLSPGYFLYVTFTYSIGSIMSFLTGKNIFGKWTTKKTIFTTSLIASLTFIILMICLETISSVLAKKILVICLIGVYSYFNGYFQGVISGLASICGPSSISFFNAGTGIAGFGSNLIAILFVFIFPTSHPSTRVLRLHHQIKAYFCFILFILSCYLILMKYFFKKYSHILSFFDDFSKKKQQRSLLNSLESSDSWKILNSEPKYSLLSVFKRTIDIWFAMIFTYYISTEILCFMIPKLTFKFDQNNQLYLLTYFFLNNFGDCLGSLTPTKWNIQSTFYIHFWTFFRALIKIYFIILLYSQPNIFSHYLLRGILNFGLGISNGFLTKNYFCISSNRFQHPDNQDLSGFLAFFSLILGVSCGTLSGVLWDVG